MTPHALGEIRHALRASPIFAVYVLATLAIAGVIGLMTLAMTLRPGFLGMAHFTDPSHRVHDAAAERARAAQRPTPLGTPGVRPGAAPTATQGGPRG